MIVSSTMETTLVILGQIVALLHHVDSFVGPNSSIDRVIQAEIIGFSYSPLLVPEGSYKFGPQVIEDGYSSWLEYYEIVPQHLVQNNHDLPRNTTINLAFTAFNETFRVHLGHCPYEPPIVEVINTNRKFRASKKVVSYYCGYESRSSGTAHGYIEQGTFTGVINTPQDDFFIEMKERSLSVVYRSSDIKAEAIVGVWKASGVAIPPEWDFRAAKRPAVRMKRASAEGLSCHIHAFADYSFFITKGLGNLRSTVNKIYYYILQANSIFMNSDFNGDGQQDKVGIHLAKVSVVQDNTGSMNMYLLPNERDAETILDAFSRLDHSEFCLASLFINRDLNDGVLGLAWQASSNMYDYPGGICQEPLIYDIGLYTYNTFLVTVRNDGRDLPDVLTALTTTHELGHAFGSPHDSETEADCSNGGPGGAFIMHPYSTGTTDPNNRRFSRCSMQYISPTITNKGDCFLEVLAPHCGDGIIQGVEECDCGYPEDCPVFDRCCFPVTDFTYACRLYNSSECSPAASICCTEECRPDTTGRVCSRPSECMEASFCDGTSMDCPPPQSKADGTLCNQETALCSSGFCSVTRCSVQGLQQCSCQHSHTNECQLCCQTQDGDCVPSAELGIFSVEGSPLYLPAGSKCRDATGFCNQQHQCVSPGKIDTIRRMKDFLKISTPKRMKLWIKNNWRLLLILLVIVACLFISSLVLHRINKAPSAQVLVKESARMLVLWQQAQFELECINEELAALEENLENERAREHAPQPLTKALARIYLLFPKAPRVAAAKVVLFASSEGEAVKEMLRLGYPMVELPKPAISPAFGLPLQ